MISSPWPQYLRSINIDGLRGWAGQEIRFEFPVIAIAGENGSGKSTILQAAAAGYLSPSDPRKSFFPSHFFPDTAWDRISGATVTYKIREGDIERTYNVRKPTQRWKGLQKRPKRRVFFYDISRTLPLDATVGYAKIANRNSSEISANALGADISKSCAFILGRNYDDVRVARSSADAAKKVSVARWSGRQYSQFHQGAGEGSTIDLLPKLQNVPNHSLVLIDEIEASLHPRSQRRLIHFLLGIARTKQIQVILTTHSGHILEELPYEARIFLSHHDTSGKEILYGITPNYALNLMDDIKKIDLYLFCEDNESKELVLEILRQYNFDLTSIECVVVGPSNLVEALGALGEQSKLPFDSIGILDPDKEEKPGCIKLPGSESPEKQVYRDILTNATGKLADRLGQNESSVRDALTRTAVIPNHHKWLEYTARILNLTSVYLWATMCQVWVKECLPEPEARQIIEYVNSCLNNH